MIEQIDYQSKVATESVKNPMAGCDMPEPTADESLCTKDAGYPKTPDDQVSRGWTDIRVSCVANTAVQIPVVCESEVSTTSQGHPTSGPLVGTLFGDTCGTINYLYKSHPGLPRNPLPTRIPCPAWKNIRPRKHTGTLQGVQPDDEDISF
jgi:hypothetical protein